MRARITVVAGLAFLVGVGATALTVRGGVWTWPRGETSIAAASADTISVVGYASQSVAPDTFTFSIGVRGKSATIPAAIDAANGLVTAVESALKSHNVHAVDIHTSALNITRGAYVPGLENSYRAEVEMSVDVRDLTAVGPTMGAALDAAGTDVGINDNSLRITQTSTALASLRQAALNDAHDKAVDWARTAGRTVGRLISVSEQPAQGTTAPVSGGNTASGDLTVSLTVTAVYALS